MQVREQEVGVVAEQVKQIFSLVYNLEMQAVRNRAAAAAVVVDLLMEVRGGRAMLVGLNLAEGVVVEVDQVTRLVISHKLQAFLEAMADPAVYLEEVEEVVQVWDRPRITLLRIRVQQELKLIQEVPVAMEEEAAEAGCFMARHQEQLAVPAEMAVLGVEAAALAIPIQTQPLQLWVCLSLEEGKEEQEGEMGLMLQEEAVEGEQVWEAPFL